MPRESFHVIRIVLCLTVLCTATGWTAASDKAEEIEILKITQHRPTKLSPLVAQNTSTLSVTRAGVVAAFYGYDGAPRFFRTSTDGGFAWGPEMSSPPEYGGGQCGGMLPDGGYLSPADSARPVNGQPGWFQINFFHFNDDFSKHTIERSRIYMPGAITKRIERRSYVWNWPGTPGHIITLNNGDLMAPMYGLFEGDAVGVDHGSRVIAVVSKDNGRTWRYQSTISNRADDPNPELPGMFAGFTESSIAYLPNGQLLCIMRSQGSHLPSEYRPLYVSWSNDLGKTWTTPKPTQPHLMNIVPTLVVLDNGVVAAVYGRPGVHVAFSIDNGHTWQDRVSFSHLTVIPITGQVDGCKVGPNRVAVIGGVGGGTHVFPLTVERIRVSPARVPLTGRILDQQGDPIAGAKVELSPNRYAADDWSIGPAYKGLTNYYHEDYFGERLMGATPVLAYRSIQSSNNYPTVESDAKGQFQFDNVRLSEYILTAEADSYAPQHRHIKIAPEAEAQDFHLKPGQKVCNRVLDDTGRPVPGACVVLNRWHTHTDVNGFFHWSVEAPLPDNVSIRVDKRYSDQYKTLETTVLFSQLERRPIILRRKG